MYLIIDTETTGFVNKKIPYDHPAQARLVQFACLLLDNRFVERASFYSLVKLPVGKTIDVGAFEAHGISIEDCETYGVHSEFIHSAFTSLLAQSKYLIAHNIAFDREVMGIVATLHFGVSVPILQKQICTMELMTDVCKLSGRYGKWKWPKLSEAVAHLKLPASLDAHDALSDCRDCAQVFKWLCFNNLVPEILNTENI